MAPNRRLRQPAGARGVPVTAASTAPVRNHCAVWSWSSPLSTGACAAKVASAGANHVAKLSALSAPGNVTRCAPSGAQDVDGCLDRAGGNVDDASEAARRHCVHRGLDQLNGRKQIGLDGAAPVVAAPCAKVTRRQPTRIGDHESRPGPPGTANHGNEQRQGKQHAIHQQRDRIDLVPVGQFDDDGLAAERDDTPAAANGRPARRAAAGRAWGDWVGTEAVFTAAAVVTRAATGGPADPSAELWCQRARQAAPHPGARARAAPTRRCCLRPWAEKSTATSVQRHA